MSQVSVPSVSLQKDPHPDIAGRLELLGKEKWELLKGDIIFKTNRIILPGFPKGLKIIDELGEYSREQARTDFGYLLPTIDQVRELIDYIIRKAQVTKANGVLLDDEDIFHTLLEMRARNPPYFIEEEKPSFFERILKRKREGYGLATSTPLGTNLFRLGVEGFIGSVGPVNIIVPDSQVKEDQRFKIRLQSKE